MEQFERLRRYLSRIEGLYEGILFLPVDDKNAHDDDVFSFFIHCYHIRDWIVDLNTLGITGKDVDSYIDKHKALRVCADLANGYKHCRLTRSMRTERQPSICGRTRRTTTWSDGRTVMRCRYTISSNTELLDALELAKECVELWDLFVEELKILKE